jgi:hypothetical protein
MADDVLDKADALMRRHRVFVAGAPQQPSLLAEPESEDIPVLTEVVDATATMPPTEDVDAKLQDLLAERLAAQRQLLADELAAWLDTELPRLVMFVLDGVTDQLVAQVTAEARAALLPRLQAALETSAAPPPAEG